MRQTNSSGLPKRPATTDAVLRRMSGGLHFHACLDCGLRYSCNCETADRNARCQVCRPVRPNSRPSWDRSTDPAECCSGNCIQITDTAVLASHKLAGPGPWFQCKTCKRHHGRLPRSGT